MQINLLPTGIARCAGVSGIARLGAVKSHGR